MRIRDGWFGRQLRRFARSNDGAAALEFALVLPPLCLILVGMFEMSMLMFAQASMEGGLREAARFGMTGSVKDPAQRQADILDIIDKHTLHLFDMKDASISFEIYNSFSNVGQPEPWVDSNGNGKRDSGESYTDVNGNAKWDADQGKSGIGDSAQIVEYTVQYEWHVMTPFMAPVFGNNGKVNLRASVVLRNEPWDATTSS